MSKKSDIEAISAWLDGELSPEKSAALAARVRQDAELSEIDRDMRAANGAYKQAMQDVLDPPSLASVRSVKDAFAKRQRRASNRSLLRTAVPVAASLVIVAGAALWFQRDAARRDTERQIETALVIESAVQNALETALSGSEVALGQPDNPLVRIIPTRTYRSASNHWCREFTEHVAVNGEQVTRRGTACRKTDGGWARIKQPRPDPANPDI